MSRRVETAHHHVGVWRESVPVKRIERTKCTAWKKRRVERKKIRSLDKVHETSEEPQGSSAAWKLRADARARSRAGEIVANAFNSHTLALGRNAIGHREVIHKVCQELGCDVIGLHKTRPDGHSIFIAAG